MIMKIHLSTRGQAIPISKLGQRWQVVIPKEICDKLGLKEGDFVEVTSTAGKVVIKPKKLVDADDVLTPSQPSIIDKRLAEGLEDMKEERVYGPFNSVDSMLHSLHGPKPAKKSKRSTRS
jgi:AbrB family looped-hinge helix DNA binding protein